MASNIESKECLWIAKVLHFELFSKEIEHFVTRLFIPTEYEDIVDIDCDRVAIEPSRLASRSARPLRVRVESQLLPARTVRVGSS
jgi:hypothetical protein